MVELNTEIKKSIISNRELKNILLNILLQFDQVCKKHHLRYYLIAGTMLGAIRHKGFIPWDDDIDVCMPRPDYEKFIKIMKDIGPYQLRAYEKGNLDAPFAKLVDTRTTVDVKYTEGSMDSMLWIDIFPIDGLPTSEEEVKLIYKKCNWYRKLLTLADCRLGEGTTKIRMLSKYILKPLAQLYGKKRALRKLAALSQRMPYETATVVGNIGWGFCGTREMINKIEFEISVDGEFEGHIFPLYSCWEQKLHDFYGDYMQLPPEEKRKGHELIAYWVDR